MADKANSYLDEQNLEMDESLFKSTVEMCASLLIALYILQEGAPTPAAKALANHLINEVNYTPFAD